MNGEDKTALEKEREERYLREDIGKYKFVVVNFSPKYIVESEFESIESVLHKIKLDLMSMAHYGEDFDKGCSIRIYLKKK